MSKLTDEFKEIRKVSTPWAAIRTTDYLSTIRTLLKVRHNGEEGPPPAAVWTCVDGVQSPVCSPTGEKLSEGIGAEIGDSDCPPFVMLKNAKENLPPDAILFMVTTDNTLFDNPFTLQAISNVRDVFKTDRRTLVILGVDPKLPPFLAEDVPVLEDPLPDELELAEAFCLLLEAQNVTFPHKECEKAASCCLGMTRFAAEEALARKLRKKSIDYAGLSKSQQEVVEQSSEKALRFERETWTFDQIGGLSAFKDFMQSLFNGPKKPHIVVRVDEIDKSITAASSGQVADNTGVSQDILKTLLTSLEDNKWMGLLACGGPGCLRGDTPIYDPIKGTTKTVKERWKERSSFHVIAWDEETKRPLEARADAPKRFTIEKMIEVTLDNGVVFAVTPDHLFWDGYGYVSARRIVQSLSSSEEVRLPSIAELDLSIPPLGASHLFQKLLGSQVDCPSVSYSCGEQPPLEEGIDQAASLPQGGSPKRIHDLSQTDDRGCIHTNTPLPSSDRHSNTDCLSQSEPLLAVGCELQHLEGHSERESHCFASSSQQPLKKSPLHTEQSPCQSVQASTVLETPLLSPSYCVRPPNVAMIQRKIVKVKNVKSEVYYDFHVPIYNNYMACGVFHHNTGKTLASICTGNQFGVKTLSLDLGAVKGSLVGASEQKIRRVVDILKTIGGENVLFIATANRLDTLPPELQRRFWLGTWFWDLPTAEEKERIWEIQRGRFSIADACIPRDEFWTGSDIRNCCQMAWVCGSTLEDAAERITIAGITSRTQTEALRDTAEKLGFRSAATPGAYKRPEKRNVRRIGV